MDYSKVRKSGRVASWVNVLERLNNNENPLSFKDLADVGSYNTVRTLNKDNLISRSTIGPHNKKGFVLSYKGLKTLNEAKKLEIIFVGSLPSFEIWYLLHFCMPNKYYNSQVMLINDLRKYIPDYEKSIKWLATARLYSKLKPKINIARERCKQLDLQLIDEDINQSCCDIDTIFELIEKKDVTLIKPNRFFKIVK